MTSTLVVDPLNNFTSRHALAWPTPSSDRSHVVYAPRRRATAHNTIEVGPYRLTPADLTSLAR
ncbi:hypothetical protein ACFWM1_26090 [Nocardia sp. NPDC058379]|uniref:hypothetical protein n=1 Tax=unclassified Nocardia TaxID=2637762 RepID=UPI003668FBF8